MKLITSKCKAYHFLCVIFVTGSSVNRQAGTECWWVWCFVEKAWGIRETDHISRRKGNYSSAVVWNNEALCSKLTKEQTLLTQQAWLAIGSEGKVKWNWSHHDERLSLSTALCLQNSYSNCIILWTNCHTCSCKEGVHSLLHEMSSSITWFLVIYILYIIYCSSLSSILIHKWICSHECPSLNRWWPWTSLQSGCAVTDTMRQWRYSKGDEMSSRDDQKSKIWHLKGDQNWRTVESLWCSYRIAQRWVTYTVLHEPGISLQVYYSLPLYTHVMGHCNAKNCNECFIVHMNGQAVYIEHACTNIKNSNVTKWLTKLLESLHEFLHNKFWWSSVSSLCFLLRWFYHIYIESNLLKQGW